MYDDCPLNAARHSQKLLGDKGHRQTLLLAAGERIVLLTFLVCLQSIDLVNSYILF
jgi:hypothetical protein